MTDAEIKELGFHRTEAINMYWYEGGINKFFKITPKTSPKKLLNQVVQAAWMEGSKRGQEDALSKVRNALGITHG